MPPNITPKPFPSPPVTAQANKDAVATHEGYPIQGEILEIRKPQILEGRMTLLGILLTVLSTIAGLAGWIIPREELLALAAWAGDNWEVIGSGVGIVIAAYGKLRRNWRK